MNDTYLFKGKILGNNISESDLDWISGNLLTELSTGRCFIIDLDYINPNVKLIDVMVEVDPLSIRKTIL